MRTAGTDLEMYLMKNPEKNYKMNFEMDIGMDPEMKKRSSRRRAARAARAARARQVRTYIGMITGAAAAAIIIAMFMMPSMMSKASSNTEKTCYKYFTSVVLTREQTLEDLAVKYSDSHYKNIDKYIDEVCEINHLSREGNTVPGAKPGVQVIVPYYSEEYK